MYKEHKLELRIKALEIIYDKIKYMEFPEYYRGFMTDEEINYLEIEISKISEKIRFKRDKLISKRNREI